jgi:hypothetical protein
MELDQVNDALEGRSWAIALGYLVQPALKAFRVAIHEAGDCLASRQGCLGRAVLALVWLFNAFAKTA